jgi:glycosyltransferase involved in cell wall biosynthesis
MIKVGFITSVLNTGHAGRGIGVYTANLLSYLKKNESAYDISVIDINDTSHSLKGFDIIHYPYFDLFFHTLPILHSTRFVVTCHDVIPLEFPDHYPPGVRGNINLFLQKMALNNVSAVLTDSYASVKAIRKYLGVDHNHLKMIYLGPSDDIHRVTDKVKLNAIKKKYNLPEKFVLNVGDINWNKNIPGLVKACLDLHLPLVLIGKQAALIDEMDVHHAELGHLSELKSLFISHSSEILRLGFIADVDFAAVCTLATIYCQPSYAEGFGLSVLHALACGTPVACSHTHSLPEVAGDSAVYFDPYDQQSIMNALSKLLTDTKLRRSVSDSGLVQAKKFSWDKAARETLSVYKHLVQI